MTIRPTSLVPEPDVTRVEIIDDTGRAFVRYYEPGGIKVSFQDDGRTLKIFAGTPTDVNPAHAWWDSL